MIDPKRIEEIDQEARKVIGDYLGDPADVSLPVDLGTILEKLKLKLYEVAFDNPAVAGAYNKSAKAIYVSSSDPKTRQFFSVAHELGHYFLNPRKATEIFYRSQLNEFDNQYSSDEQEANWFAATLLMPQELVKKVWKEEKSEAIVAAQFGVSASAAHWRLKNLKII
jgi:Zn-dependent peptidase ImmA (M78 family)